MKLIFLTGEGSWPMENQTDVIYQQFSSQYASFLVN